MIRSLLLYFATLIIYSLAACDNPHTEQEYESYDIAIIGGGASGTSAGIQAARLGARTIIIEPTEWLGGMLTSAGVSAIDGNHNLPSGIWGEFRDSLINRHGSLGALASGWVSNTLFSPEEGQEILSNMTSGIANLTVLRNTEVGDVSKVDSVWNVKVNNHKNIRTKILIDATELGDIAAFLEVPHEIGMKDGSAESINAKNDNDIIQDLTYVAILETYEGKNHMLERQDNYSSEEFACACNTGSPEIDAVDCQTMLNYGKLPNGKFMINWPNCGNDIYLNIIELSKDQRNVQLEKAKQMTFRFVYYIQNDLGFKNLGISDSTFPTEDKMPLIAYHRESRRILGKVRLLSKHLENPYEYNLYRTGVAVGDYPIDHHHKKNVDAPKLDFIGIKIPSYNVPLGALLPKNQENFIVAEKSISVSNVVNGATRLQPVVLGIGQAAGVLAGVAISENKDVYQVGIREVQRKLLENDAYIMPFMDVKTDDEGFVQIQKAGAIGILKGKGIPNKWANQTWIYPDSLMLNFDLETAYAMLGGKLALSNEKYVTSMDIFSFVVAINKEISDLNTFMRKIDTYLDDQGYLDRRAVAMIIDEYTDLFERPIDYQGNFIKE